MQRTSMFGFALQTLTKSIGEILVAQWYTIMFCGIMPVGRFPVAPLWGAGLG